MCTQSPFTGLIWAQKENFKDLVSEKDQIDRSPISRALYLYRVSTKCCQIFNIGKGHNYLGGKPPKY